MQGPLHPEPPIYYVTEIIGQRPCGHLRSYLSGQRPYVRLWSYLSGQCPYACLRPHPSGQRPYGRLWPHPSLKIKYFLIFHLHVIECPRNGTDCERLWSEGNVFFAGYSSFGVLCPAVCPELVQNCSQDGVDTVVTARGAVAEVPVVRRKCTC